MSEKARVRVVVGKRVKPRRHRGDRRQSLRWGPEDTDRRGGSGRRREDKTLDSIRSVYGPAGVSGSKSSKKKNPG